MSDHRPLNYNQITENIWLGTNMCCALHNETLLKLGFEADIDLEAARPEEPPKTMIYLWLPTPDQRAPAPDQIIAGVSLITALVKQRCKIYVHCKNGHGRGPTLVTAYLISTGLGLEAAFSLIKAKRSVVHLNEVQRAALEEFSQSITLK